MGKGNRNRQGRTEDMALNPQKYVQQKKKSNTGVLVGTIVAGVIALLLVVVIVINLITSSGLALRMRTAAETDDFEIDGTMMSYLVHSAFTNHYSYMQQIADSYSMDISYLIQYDPIKSLKTQVRDTATGETWFDYFAETAVAQAEELLVYAQAAKANGVALDDEDQKAVDEAIDALETNVRAYVSQAKASGEMISYDSYMSQTFGEGVSMSDIRNVMELQQLASKYAAMVKEDFLEALTDDDVAAYYEENKKTYQYADYLSWEMTAEKDDKAENADEQFASDKADVDALTEKLMAATSEEAFKAVLTEYLTEKYTAAYMESDYDKLLADAKGETGEEKEAAAKEELDKKVTEAVEKDMANILSEDKAYTADDELSTWIFGGEDTDAAAVNTTFKLVEDEEEDEYTVTVYLLTEAAHRKEQTTRTFTYLTFSKSANQTLDMANEVKGMLVVEPSADVLEEVANSEEYAGKVGFGSYEEVARGGVGVDALDEWMYADGRAAGDFTVLTDTTETDEYYIVIYLDEIGAEEWYVSCRDAKVEAQMTEWNDEAVKTYAVTVNEDILDDIKM